ncbi:DUF1816 domain-containing protein [Synechococcus sp. CS-1325]|uniref:DUF1816 domain-containing protein n=1 Tax=unclassified Synechococcus TaxID=2626047 RepID=UPI000DB34EDE|nr:MULTISPECIES: DUF1816 domain-containing protein [unclassified Synechococcus]PZV00704.1 MAG: hypothetical protein DCF24_06395 [Cyanobium sp.]MCT0198275.1 DUF1816 domain-containing protein [Synechococcus sp. CS-1325]MCT0213957.1 DUF1816 domain-containing protein [Synechococcus sp. CS-1326]MCT0230859.1 DUF1816 domain-containing protein [Synechococcus sp. CS-1324]MCT0233533.1 DUF1816 domain-containing protein [Synechococcus sp. CS-1327]
MNALLQPLRSLANGLGLAWWAKVQTESPDVIYWFGPFLRRRELENKLPAFLADLQAEAPASLSHEVVRLNRGEPLTELLGPG